MSLYRLMIVDDEYEIRTGICNYFPWGEIGFMVAAQAENGKEALKYIVNNPVDVVLCDVKMPVMSGIELAAELHKSTLRTKVIFLSAYRYFEYAQKALSYGVKNYIVKPVKYEELVDVFTKVKVELDRENPDLQAKNKPGEYYPCSDAVTFHEKIIIAAKKYIKENFSIVTLEQVAKLAHMNPYYFSKFFKDKTGQNFYDYVIEVKMQKAAELLENINYKTNEVSELVGYTNPKNFSRAFRNYYNKTPSQYRNSGCTARTTFN